ncbi:MAG: hypothetical protein ACKO8V_00155, partial [Actinomycetota bacterium]
ALSTVVARDAVTLRNVVTCAVATFVGLWLFALYDTLTREVKPLAMRENGKLGIYLCGPTVYGPPHLGHGRATIVYDVLRWYLEWRGIKVRLVSNITDIDDRIIERANREGRPWQDITHKCESVWFDEMRRPVHRRATQVDAQLALFAHCKRLHLARQGVIQREHATSLRM